MRATSQGAGIVLHEAARYDLLVWLATLGREQALRERIVDVARLEPGESVLDVGCGTGSLVIAAKRRVGDAGVVHGIDASPQMLARARRKARKAGADVNFESALAQALSYADAIFDAVLATMMFHHLPRRVRLDCVREMRRVAKPGGRVLIVDFGRPARQERNLFTRFHRHGHVDFGEVSALLGEAGLQCVETGPVGFGDLQFAFAMAASGT